MKNELPIKIEIIVYREMNNVLSFLLLKRSPTDGSFWQPVTGTLQINESIIGCLSRELKEETGLIEIFLEPKFIYSFAWIREEETILELVYTVKIRNDSIVLSNEHTDCRWCTYSQAVRLLKHKENRIAFSHLKKLVLE